MILLAHMLLGAAMAKLVPNPFLAVFLAFLSHYFLDIFPHVEYDIKNIKNKNWKKSLPDAAKVCLDFFAGLAAVYFLSRNDFLTILCALFSIIPDGLSVINSVLNNKLLQLHSWLHQGKLHFLSHKKIPLFWRIFTQAFAACLSIYILAVTY